MSDPSTTPAYPDLPTIVIAGPTASGKSELALCVAEQAAALGRAAEVISADAFQVYRGMDIGTAKLPAHERRGIPHHLIDVRDPAESFSVDQWLMLARSAEDEAHARGALPIVVGGTHLYIKAFLDGLFEGPPPDPVLRAELIAMSAEARRAELQRADPQAATRIHPNDVRRTVRALEVFRQTGRRISELQTQWSDHGAADPARRLVVLSRPVEELNRRINARVKAMMQGGLVEETLDLWRRSAMGPTAREALGYRQLADLFERRGVNPGRAALEDAQEQIKVLTRHFAKAQRTWLRRLAARPGTLALDLSTTTTEQAARACLHPLLEGPADPPA